MLRLGESSFGDPDKLRGLGLKAMSSIHKEVQIASSERYQDCEEAWSLFSDSYI